MNPGAVVFLVGLDALVFYGAGRAAAGDERWERRRQAFLPLLVVLTAVALLGLANGLLDYGPTP